MEATVSLNGKENDLARRKRLFEEYAGSWNMPDEIFPDGDVMKFIKDVEKDDDKITMQLLKDCYGALECWDDDFVEEIEYSRSFKTRDERLMELWEDYE